MTRRRDADGESDPRVEAAARESVARKTLLLGVGLDGDDGHRRVSRGRDVLLVGGSEDTHGAMQERAIRFNEELDRRGMRLADVRCADELREIADKAGF